MVSGIQHDTPYIKCVKAYRKIYAKRGSGRFTKIISTSLSEPAVQRNVPFYAVLLRNNEKTKIAIAYKQKLRMHKFPAEASRDLKTVSLFLNGWVTGRTRRNDDDSIFAAYFLSLGWIRFLAIAIRKWIVIFLVNSHTISLIPFIVIFSCIEFLH